MAETNMEALAVMGGLALVCVCIIEIHLKLEDWMIM